MNQTRPDSRGPKGRLVSALMLALCAASCSPTPTARSAGSVSFPDTWRYASDEAPVTAEHAMVVSTDRYASEVGARIMQEGGNAVDAAIAVSMALAVVNPEAGNVGGGGFMVVRMADGTSASLDYREKAPLRASRDMYVDADGNTTDKSLVGHLAIGVPGTVMGMWEAHRRFGSRPWEELLEPAAMLADGFEVHERFRRNLVNSEEGIRLFATTAATFLPDGHMAEVGETFRQPELARTLRRIRDHGADGFYRGETADLIVAEMERGGGIISHEDLEAYTAAWRDPIEFTYRDYTVYSMPPSSSGGATMAEMANIMEQYELDADDWHSADMVHALAESSRRSFSDRNEYLADPDFVDIPLERMTSKAYAEMRGSDITDRATPSSDVGPGLEAPHEGEHTTHFSVVDNFGNAVSVTTTINSWFGSKVTVRDAGFVLNNEMDDFAAKPGTPNQYGLVQGANNAVGPGKRMLSAMTPSIVVDPNGELFFVTGTPGGPTIITTVFQTIMNVIDYGMNVVQAVNAPRVHHQHLPDQIFFEQGGLTAEVVAALEAKGHTVVERSGVSGDAQVIMVMPDGSLQAASDRRRGGAAVGW
jgi:gamma-glutamyltranspeptidase/glutathione hydrolase